MTKEVDIHARGLHLKALQWGDPDAPPVLALHGWLDNAATFAPIGAALADAYCVVAVDLPGHGRSQHRPLNAEYHYVNWVLDTAAILDALGWETCFGLGHSMGAGVLSLTAGAQPHRFERLALVEGLGPFTTEPNDAPDNLRMALKGRAISGPPGRRVYEDRELMVERRLAQSMDLDVDSVEPLMARAIEAIDDGFRFTHDPRLRGRSVLRFTEAQVLAFFASIQAPALLVRADDGLAYDPDALQARMDAFPDLTIHRVEGSHHVHLAHPDRVIPPIREFFSQAAG